MNTIKSHFEIHKRFRNGIFILALVLFTTVFLYYFYSTPKKSIGNFEELTPFQKQIDSLKAIAENQKKEYQQKPFNPNFITEYKGYTLGLMPNELDKLYAFREQNKWINSTSDFKKVTGVSDSLLAKISPLFKFPEWTQNKNSTKTYQKTTYLVKSFTQKEDLNTVNAKDLQEKINVPDFIAHKIIAYRNKIEGFVSDLQLKDIKGLYETQRHKILGLYTVKTPKTIQKVNINTASVKELVEIPYFDFETALEIKDFIEEHNKISSFEELGEIEGFYLEKIDRIALYLTLN